MYLTHLRINNHPILKKQDINLVNPKTNRAYAIIAFIGENGCGKTTLLKEIFNYKESQYIADKETKNNKDFDALYLRQGSMYYSSIRENGRILNGKDFYPVNSNIGKRKHVKNINSETLEILKLLGDETILDIFGSGHIGDVFCGEELSKIIDGREHEYNISDYSSGQQELLLKLKDLNNHLYVDTDCVLLDEPETSLHPKWQKKIVDIIRSILVDKENQTPQLFIATHSENVLESIINRDDALIIRLFRDGNQIKTEAIGDMDLLLPNPTFAELDYVIFHISSFEYHDQLLIEFGNLHNIDGMMEIDRKIRNHPSYREDKYGKVWKNKGNTYRTLPLYIRNYFHHPKEGAAPTSDELDSSILFLREIIEEMKKELTNTG